jgi:hypothetical protein
MRPLPDESLDAPAYTRALTSLPEFRRSQALRAAARDDVENRTFNQRFWATLASEAGSVPSGISTGWWARWVTGSRWRIPDGLPTPDDLEVLRHRW